MLPKIVETYNKTPHRGIFNYKPVDINKRNEMQLWQLKNKEALPEAKGTYNLLDHVTISRIVRSPFIKNFDQNWSEDVFQIVGIDNKTTPVMYIIQDLDGTVIQGKFYKEELQVVTKPNIFRIEKVIRSKGKGVDKQYLVKWYGYSDIHNSWVKAS